MSMPEKPSYPGLPEGTSSDSEIERMAALREKNRALIMATVDEDGFPSLSTLPYVWHNGAFWVLMSDLAPHTVHVQTNPTVEIMLLEDESETHNIYGRLRVSWRADVSRVAGSDSRAERVNEALRIRHGNIVDLLLKMSDFHLVRIVPGSGRLVSGFGKAYRIDGFELVEHLRGA